MSTVKIGVIGCGTISSAYMKNCQRLSNLELVACADLIHERAKAQAEEFAVPKACSVEELLADDGIEIVINLTIPQAHSEVNLQILEAGKHAYVEKPLALNRDDGKKVLDTARQKNLLVGCAPDTFMGAGIQTCRKLIDDGWIGTPIAATAFMMNHGHEHWHPDPGFYYQPGGGPMFDMGPYYLTALVNLLGPARQVSGMTKAGFPERTITSEEKYGTKIQVEVPTFVNGMVNFKNGAIGTIIMSFDVWGHKMPFIEIYGSEGTLRCPDPNTYGGVPMIKRGREAEWSEIPFAYEFSENSRGIGVANMAEVLLNQQSSFRAQGGLAYHVLDMMQAFYEAADQGCHVELTSHCEQPQPMPVHASYTM